jgi:hypothetical protein
MSELKFPSEVIDLPSKGLLYPKENPLSSGQVEMKYMTAKEEDILTNQAYISKGIVIDKLLESLILSKVNLDDLYPGDKNAILIAARVLGYGKDYSFTLNGKTYTVDLSTLENVKFDESLFENGTNDFKFICPSTSNQITFKLLNGHDDKAIEKTIKGLKKLNKESSPELTSRLKYMITSVNGDEDQKSISDFVDNYFLARDARAFREYIKEIQPNIDLTFDAEGEELNIPIGLSFFWPDV